MRQLDGRRSLARFSSVRTIFVGGEAAAPQAAARLGVDEAVALSVEADLATVVEHAAAAGARQVHVAAGFSDEVARAFAARRLRVQVLGPPEQMRLFRR
jgi:hypothetical protein